MSTETDRVYDELLVTLACSGNRQAGDRLALRWQPRLLRTARRLLRDDEQARDAVQEAWTSICRGWLTLRDPARFPAWAFGILHRKCTDTVRKISRDRSRTTPITAANEPSLAPRGETLTSLDQAFAALSPAHREVATLYFGEGLTLSEIASVTHVPTGTVKSRIFHARQQLKAALTGE